MKLLAACTATSQPIAAKSGRTGHFKVPQSGAVDVGATGLVGDTIVDTAHHGGPDQAVYIFTEDDRRWWETELARPLPAGFFGENLLIDGLACADLALGDILDVGEVRLQITAPRIPCVTWNARISDANGVRMFNEANRPGAYARVLRNGSVSAFDPITLTPNPGLRISVPEHFRRYISGDMDVDYLNQLLDIPCHSAMHQLAVERLAKET